MDEPEGSRGVLIIAKDALITPVRVLTSKSAQRVYISTVLLLCASLFLVALSVAAYILFYNAYVPRVGFERIVHLQFPVHQDASGSATHPWPHGFAELYGDVVSQQPYDVDVELHLPRTPGNIALGNFMLDLELLSSAARPSPTSYPLHPDAAIEVKNESKILAKSSRPATLTYYSQVVDHVNMAAALPLYTLGWKLEAEKLDVRMMEGVEFKRGWRNIPKGLKLEVRTDARNGGQFQIYGCKIKFMARFRGLRSFMYKHRIVSFILFTTTFWIVSTTTTLLVYFALAYALFPSTPPSVPMKHERLTTDPIKHEPDGISDIEAPSFSDTSRTFPTLRQQEPLHFSATSPRIKTEPGERDRDSGIGSSLPEDAAPGPSSLSAARAARRYPTPEVDGQEMQMLQRPGTPGEAADDEEEDADFVEDELAEGPVNGIGEEEHGFETRAGDVREGMRRRRSRLSTRAGEGGGP